MKDGELFKTMDNKIKNLFFTDLNQQLNSSWIGPGTNPYHNKMFNDFLLNSLNNFYFDEENYYIVEYFPESPELKITYKINSNGFRSNHFKKLDENKISILTGGCSNSFGQDLPNDLRWQSFLLNNIDKDNIELFDISSMSASIRLIIRNVFSFIRNYGKPDYIFLILPDIARNFLYDSKTDMFISVYAHKQHLEKKKDNDDIYQKYSLFFNEKDGLMDAVEDIWSLEELCKQSNIKLFWSTWDFSLGKFFYNNSSFKNFVPLLNYSNGTNKWENNPKYKNNINNLSYWKHAADGQHFGSKISSYIGDVFAERFIDD